MLEDAPAQRPALWPRQISIGSIRGRLAFVLALVFLPAVLQALQAGWAGFQSRRDAIEQAAGVGELRAMVFFKEDVAELRELGRLVAAQAPGLVEAGASCDLALADLRRKSPKLAAITLLNADASVLCASAPKARNVRTKAGPLIEAANSSGEPAVGFVANPQMSDEPVLGAVARSSILVQGQPVFAGVSSPLAPMLWRVIQNSQNKTGFAALLNAQGEMLFSVGDAPGNAAALKARFANEKEAIDGDAFRQGRFWAVASRVSPQGLILVRSWRAAPYTRAQLFSAGWALIAPLALSSLAVAATWFAVEIFVARPLTVVERLARAYARGERTDAEESLLRTAPTEISSLRRTLAAMAKTLRSRETRITDALNEERALLREVNHRVKNNLQMVSSLLSIQSRAALDPAEARGLLRARERVLLLAVAYTTIYESGEVRDVALDQLVREVARAVVDGRGGARGVVRLNLLLCAANASVDRAVPIAFVVGEGLAMLLDRSQGSRIREADLTLERSEDGGIRLSIVSRESAAISQDIESAEMRLLAAFARQLDGEIRFSAGDGFIVELILKSGSSPAYP